MGYKILTLTDHSGHSRENSLYALMRTMLQHSDCESIDVASRGNAANDGFFHHFNSTLLQVVNINEDFAFQSDGRQFLKQTIQRDLKDYDVVMLRLPRPIPVGFFDFLRQHFPEKRIVNRPSGIEVTSSKAYLLNFPDICPPIELCDSVEVILQFKERFPIVLKPLRNYGGKGIVRIEGEEVQYGGLKFTFNDFLPILKENLAIDGAYLGMKYLKNVSQGDKRVILVNGQILGASLRLPPEGSWMCNVAQGGSSVLSEADEQEELIAARISPYLLEQGIVVCGFDTLVEDDGRRVLSEINTLSVGGLPQAAKQSGRPVVKQTVNLIFNYLNTSEKG
ncbi:MAG: RimK family alpha-L-glutamate ligase [Chitinophagales bacterium]